MLINGQPETQIAAADRGLSYGDGVFRTLRCDDGGVRFWLRQYRQLAADCAVLGLPCPEAAVWEADIRQLLAASPDAALKLTVTRGLGQRGYAEPQPLRITRICQRSPLPQYPAVWLTEGVSVRWCDWRLATQPALAGVKHLNRLDNVMARREWQDPAIYEGLLLDQEGWVVEGVMSNLYLLRDGQLQTPAIDRAGVAGVSRQVLLEAAASLGLQPQSTRLRPADVQAAQAVWLSNSLAGILPVAKLGEHSWAAHPLTPILREAFQNKQNEETWRCLP